MVIYPNDFENLERYPTHIPVRTGCEGECMCLGTCQEIEGYVSREEYTEFKKNFRTEKEWLGSKLVQFLGTGRPPFGTPIYNRNTFKYAVGYIVQLLEEFLGEPKGTLAFVYDTYGESPRHGISLITQNGVNLSGFSFKEQKTYLRFVRDSNIRYVYTHDTKLRADFEAYLNKVFLPQHKILASLFGENNDEVIKCEKCDWYGPVSYTFHKNYTSSKESWQSLAGREGVHYHCPKCDELIKTFYWKFS